MTRTNREFTRRDFERMSIASAFGAAACPWLPGLAAAADKKPAKACIVLWMSGGPSQTDTWDLKVGHKNGGPSKERATTVPGLRISEHLPKMAEMAKDIGIIRSMTTKEGEHQRATQLLHTGQLPSEAIPYPALGSMLAKQLGDPEHDLPSYITIAQGGPMANVGAGFLGPQYAPMAVTGISDNPNTRANLTIDYLKPDRPIAASDQDVRRQLLADLQGDFERRNGSGAATKAHAASYRKAQKMIDTEAKGGFRLDEEPAKLRDAYGRNRFGQGCLLARRLLERGVSFVEVGLDGWDTHGNNFEMVKTLSDTLDPAFATLLADLKERGMLANTLVVWMGEFGRTPLINPQGGRDHFPNAWSTVLAGAGVKGGQAIGKTAPDGQTVADRPVSVADFLATVFTAVGVSPKAENLTWDGRPIPLVKGGTVIEELVLMSTPRRIWTGFALGAVLVSVAGLCEAGRGPASQTPATDKAAPVADPETVRDVFLLLDRGPLHIRLKVTIAGKSPQAARRDYLARLFKSLDTDSDGKLSRAEFERSPLNTSRRGPGGRALAPKEAAETVPALKLTEALERVVGETLAFRQDNTARKTDDQVFFALDTNRDGRLSEDEIRDAPALLLARDQDDDECLTIDEFTLPETMLMAAPLGGPTPERPLAAVSTLLVDGTGPLFGPRLVRRYDRNADGKLTQPELQLAAARFKVLDADGDGKLSTDELKAFHKQAPDVEAALELVPPPGQTPRVVVTPGSHARSTRPDVALFGLGETDVALGVRSFDPVKTAVAEAQASFNRLDVDQNGYLDREELKENIRFQRGLFETIDTDGDDKIFWPEMEAYVRSRAEAAATRCDIVLHDLGHGFFEALDRNHDGRIGLREVRVAQGTLTGLRKPGQTVLRANDPPRRLHLEVIRGAFHLFGSVQAGESTVPRLVVQPRVPVGPIWFQRMDRNLDGDLTWKEFLGPRHVFEELDADHDSLIDPFEAEKAEQLYRK